MVFRRRGEMAPLREGAWLSAKSSLAGVAPVGRLQLSRFQRFRL